MTTGDFKSADLAKQQEVCALKVFNLEVAQTIGAIAVEISSTRALPISISIRVGDWEVFKVALPGAKQEQDGWIERKYRVVQLTGNSTLHERVKAEELGIDWHVENQVTDKTHALHGGCFPLKTQDGILHGALLISGLPQVEDHLLAFEILQSYLKS
ncbi:MAG: heme-binding protein [Candidatus Nanopelagicaceae bacterium]